MGYILAAIRLALVLKDPQTHRRNAKSFQLRACNAGLADFLHGPSKKTGKQHGAGSAQKKRRGEHKEPESPKRQKKTKDMKKKKKNKKNKKANKNKKNKTKKKKKKKHGREE